MVMPPRSAMFSPSVSLPLTCKSSIAIALVVLLHELVGFGVKMRAVVGSPPVAQVAVGVGAAALIVEAVGDFVADHGADPAVVYRVVGIGIKKRRLQNAGGEDDFVQVGL